MYYISIEQIRTNMSKFKATISIPENVIDDVITTALEGGSNYWYFIDQEKVTTPDNFKRNEKIHYEILDKVYQGGTLQIFDAENTNEKLGELSVESIQKGLNLLADKSTKVLYNIVDECYDAGDADVFFQLAVLGEITFG